MLTRAVERVADHARRVVQLEIELAKIEIGRKIAALGIGLGLVLAGAVLGLLALGFVFATIAAAFATFVSTWLALLVVTGILLLLAGGLVGLGVRSLKKGSPPIPELALQEAKLTKEALRNGSG